MTAVPYMTEVNGVMWCTAHSGICNEGEYQCDMWCEYQCDMWYAMTDNDGSCVLVALYVEIAP